MKILINKTDKNILPITKIYDLGSVTTTIDDLLNQSTITLEKNITPILSIDGSNYLINNFNPTNIKEDFEAIITESDLIPFGGGTGGDSRPYKVYTALLTQSGTDAPVAIVLENTLGGDVVWTRFNTGEYLATLAGAFIDGKTYINISQNVTDKIKTGIINTTENTLNTIKVNSSSNFISYEDDILTNTSIEIRVYN